MLRTLSVVGAPHTERCLLLTTNVVRYEFSKVNVITADDLVFDPLWHAWQGAGEGASGDTRSTVGMCNRPRSARDGPAIRPFPVGS